MKVSKFHYYLEYELKIIMFLVKSYFKLWPPARMAVDNSATFLFLN